MATPKDLLQILLEALQKKAQDPDIQPGDLEAIVALGDDPHALAEALGVELDGQPMEGEDDEAGEDEDDFDGDDPGGEGPEESVPDAMSQDESSDEYAAQEDEQAQEGSARRTKSRPAFREETLAAKLARKRRAAWFAD